MHDFNNESACNAASSLIQAHVSFHRGETNSGMLALKRAFKQVKTSGYQYLDTIQPAVIRKLCLQAISAGIASDSAVQLMQQFGLNPERQDKPVCIQTFGTFRVMVHGRDVAASLTGGSKPFQMLKFIIAFMGRAVPKYIIMDQLWPDKDGDMAENAFSTTLSRLREKVGKNTLRLRGKSVSLNLDACRVDCFEFQQCTDRSPSVQQCERLIELYHGVFLPFEDQDWASDVREKCHRRIIHIVLRYGQYLTQSGHTQTAIDLYTRFLDMMNTEHGRHQLLTQLVDLETQTFAA